jgi:hypothetical protein
MSDPYRFVVCPSYHGATVLAFLLNNHPLLSCLGDTLPWADRRQSCSCGARVSHCDFWQEIHRRVEAQRWREEPQMLPLLPRVFAAPALNRPVARALIGASLLFGPGVRRLAPRAAAEFTAAYRDFYAAIRDLHQTRHVVDGSKSVGKILALTALSDPDRRARVVHLVRDPRGYAWSLRSRDAALADIGASGREWRLRHRNIERLLGHSPRFDYLPVRYEDLCLDSDRTLARIFGLFDVDPLPIDKLTETVRKNHLIGNRMLKTFDGTLSLDQRWRQALMPEEQDAVMRAATPLAGAYGYR